MSRRTLTRVVLVLLVVAATAAGTAMVRTPAVVPVAGETASAATLGGGTVVFSGGALAAGGVLSPALSAALDTGIEADVRDHADAGLLTPGRDGSLALVQQAQLDVEGTAPDAVVVQAHEKDLTGNPAAVRLAALHLVDRLRVSVPTTTRLILIAPLAPRQGDPVRGAAVRRALRSAAAEKRVHFADPVSDGWLPAASDDSKPDAGQTDRVAEALASYLRQLGLAA